MIMQQQNKQFSRTMMAKNTKAIIGMCTNKWFAYMLYVH